MRANFKLQRLYIDQDLNLGQMIELDREKANYLLNVLRLNEGDEVLLFNGKHGEWRSSLVPKGRKNASLNLLSQEREQPQPSTFGILFAPIKVGRLEYMVQKITEMGAGHITPVFTDHTQLHKINLKRLKANIIEAAEQCGVLNIPDLNEPLKFSQALAEWEEDRQIIFCDEAVETNNPLAQLNSVKAQKFSLLVGPEGGFSKAERDLLNGLDCVTPIPLGPRILRADTAIVAAMSVIQATIGDWQ